MPLTPVTVDTLSLEAILDAEDISPFFPGTSLYSAPYPFPGPTSYPGSFSQSLDLVSLPVVAETLTVLEELG